MRRQRLFALLAWIAVCGAAFAQSGGLQVFPQAVEMNFPQGYDVYSDAGRLVKTVPGPTSATVKAKDTGKSFTAGEVFLSDWSYDHLQHGKTPNWIVPRSNQTLDYFQLLNDRGLVVYRSVKELTFPYGYSVFSNDGELVKTVPGPTSIALKGEFAGNGWIAGRTAYLSDWSYNQLQQGKIPNWVVPKSYATTTALDRADSDLNRLCEELCDALTDAQKEQLKQSQKQWTERRNSFAASVTTPIKLLEFLADRTAALRAQQHIVICKKHWIDKGLSSKEYKHNALQAQPSVRICLPSAIRVIGQAKFVENDAKLLTVEIQRSGVDWDFHSVVRVWDVSKRALVGELTIPLGVLDMWYSDRRNEVLFLLANVSDRAPFKEGFFISSLDSIRGSRQLTLEEVQPLNDLFVSQRHEPKPTSFGSPSLRNLPLYADIFSTGNRYGLNIIGGPALDRLPAGIQIVAESPILQLRSDGTLRDKNGLGDLSLLGQHGKRALSAAASIAYASTNRKLACWGLSGLWLVDLQNLSARCVSENGPSTEDVIVDALLESDDKFIAMGAGFSVMYEWTHTSGWTNPAGSNQKAGNHGLRDSIIVHGSTEKHVVQAETEISSDYHLRVSIPELFPKARSFDVPSVLHSPELITAFCSQDGKYIVLAIHVRGGSLGDYSSQAFIINRLSGVVAKEFSSSDLIGISTAALLQTPLSQGKLLCARKDGYMCVLDTNTGAAMSTYHDADALRIHGGQIDQDNRVVYVGRNDGSVSVVKINETASFNEEARVFVWEDGRLLIVDPATNVYAGIGDVGRRLVFASKDRMFPFEQFDLRLNRPDIVLERLGAPDEAVEIAKQLRQKQLKRMGVTEEMLKPDFHVPELEIVADVPTTTDAGEVNLSIKAADSKYPLERLKVYVNNVPVNGRDGELLREESKADRGLLGRIAGAFIGAPTGPQTLERTIPVKLAAGRNKIQVSVLNNAGAESLYANAEVNCTAKRPKPTLYTVAIGVSEYSDPEWNLKYAAKDARDVLARLKDKAGDQYGEVKELLLTDKDVTKENLAKVREFLKDATIDDTVLMFVAGHGLLDSNYDYYFGTTDIEFNNPADKGIAFEEFDDLLADLSSLKKSLLIDTCHAGELDEEEKTLLASAGGTSAPLPAGNGLAMRSIGTRGMNVKAIEGARGASEWYDRLQGLFVDLRRGSGSTILSSSAGAEYALESSEQQNGLFTYAVLEAFDGEPGADTNKDGSVQMSELGEYVKKRVSELTNNKQTPNTRRVNLEGDFMLAEVQ